MYSILFTVKGSEVHDNKYTYFISLLDTANIIDTRTFFIYLSHLENQDRNTRTGANRCNGLPPHYSHNQSVFITILVC